MKKLKKHELLEKAMRDYPAGTVFHSVHTEHTIRCQASGMYIIDDDGDVRNAGTSLGYDGGGYVCVGEKWAEIVTADKPSEKESLLSGKCAIMPSNEREFSLLMQHYNSKEWVAVSGCKPLNARYVANPWSYEHYFGNARTEFLERSGYKIISFTDFAKEVGIDVPEVSENENKECDISTNKTVEDYKLVYRSEDGVNIFRNNFVYISRKDKTNHKWCVPVKFWLTFHQQTSLLEEKETRKGFSTGEAAEKWVEEQNKPKQITIDQFGKYTVTVTTDSLTVYCVDGDIHEANLVLSSAELEEIYKAYQTLKQ